MRFTGLTRLSAIAVVAMTSSLVSAQFTVREFNLAGQQIGGGYQAYYYATSPVDQQWLDDFGYVFIADVEDFRDQFSRINMGGNQGWFHNENGNAVNNSGLVLGSDYILDARAAVTIPAGTWTIAFNSDDGGQLTLPGADFFGHYRSDDPYDKNSSNQIWHQGTRSHESTGASFTVPEGQTLETVLHSTMFERGGNDSFEIAIRPEGPGSTDPRPDTDGWVLLEDGALGWEVRPTDELPAQNAMGLPLSTGGEGGGHIVAPSADESALGVYVPTAAAVIKTTGDGMEMQPGLYQRWYAGDNPGTLLGQLQTIAAADPDVASHDGPTWWSGNTPTAQIRAYPSFVGGVGDWSASGDNDQYLAWLSGEINLPEGPTLFRLGADEYKYLAIDSGGNGTAGDQVGEVLMDNNVGVHSTATSANGALVNTVAVESTGGWTAIELIVAEGSGDDSNILYWDAENKGNFPFAVPFSDESGFAPQNYAVPEDALRSVTRGDVEGIVLTAGLAGTTLDLEVSSSLMDSDKVVLRDPDFSTELDLAGATIIVSALAGETLNAGDQFALFDADNIIGLGEAIFNLEGGLEAWDISGLLDGSSNQITYVGVSTPPMLPSLPGDADGDGDVDFDDFVIMINSFNQAVDPPGSGADFSGNGVVDFDDFVALTNNFGASAAASVPEPTSASLLCVGGLLAGLFRRRRGMLSYG